MRTTTSFVLLLAVAGLGGLAAGAKTSQMLQTMGVPFWGRMAFLVAFVAAAIVLKRKFLSGTR